MRESLLVAAMLVLLSPAARAQEAQAPRAAGPTVAGPPKMAFEEVVHRAMQRNTTSALALEDIRRSEALVQQARSSWLPTLTANGTYTRLDSDRTLGDRVIASADSINANLTLTVPIISPRNWVATSRAKENREFAKLTYVDAQRQVAIAAGRAYLTVIGQRRILESSMHARDTARVHEEFAKSRLTGGVGNRLDAVRASQERATAETRVQTQSIGLTRAQEALGIVLGENGPVDAADAVLATPPTLAAALGDAESRSDVLSSRDRVEYARKAVRDSYAEYLPILTGVVQPFYQNPSSLTLPTTGWQAQLLLTIPLFDGGNRYGLKHERDAVYEQSKLRLDAALRQARSDVRLGFEAMQRADDALVQAREAAKLAQEALDLSQLAYRAGATSNIEVVDAQRRARDAATDAAIAEDAARQARLDLLAAAGRFP